MTSGRGSPVSPVTPASPPLPTTSTSAPTLTPGTARTREWRPFTFRWYFLLLPACTSVTLGIAILVIMWYSQSHHGLGSDDGSSAILFGWRFTPTLLAVLYTQLTVILFEDVKRTEPFARLAKASAAGASAYGTVLQTPRSWWSIFSDALFRRKLVGKTSWCLICATFINTLALLAISPLSSALLTSEEVVIARPQDFHVIAPNAGAQLPIMANRETYFRSMSSLMRNVSTSAWITDTSLTFPFWPATEEAQMGPELASKYNAWQTTTSTLHAELKCQNMTLQSADLEPKRYSAYGIMGKGPYNGTVSMVTYVLTSGDGCRYELSIHPTIDLASNGGLTWSNTSTYYPITPGVLSLGRIPFAADVSPTSPYAQQRASEECKDRDIIILSTAWTKPYLMEQSPGANVPLNRTYERSQDFRMEALLCESQYSLEERNVTTTLSPGRLPLFNASSSRDADRKPITDELVDIPGFEIMTRQDQWRNYFNRDSIRIDAANAIGQQQDTDMSTSISAPGFSGLGPLLGALYSFNVTQMLDDNVLALQAARVKGRFFTECLRAALDNPQAVNTTLVKGEVSLIEERVLVLTEIAITLAVLLLVSFVLLIMVFIFSRLSYRPLNLSIEPTSAVGHGMLLRPQLARTSTLRSMHQTCRPDIHRALRSDTFYTLDGCLHTGQCNSKTALINTGGYAGRWQPLVIRLRMLCALSLFLILVLIAVLVLNAFSAQSRLSQIAFIYEADVSKLGLSFSTFAPISIAPTVISIAIGLWWDQLDMAFRILQPYIAMTRRPTPIRNGAGLTYRSKTWAGAAFKALRNRHWVLFIIAVGSVLCQILTVSMSALFERRPANVARQMTLERTLETRQAPIITTVQTAELYSNPSPDVPVYSVLDNLLLDPPKNWLPGAAIQLSLNGSRLAWTSDGWSFIPLDISSLPYTTQSQQGFTTNTSSNVTITTSALRARLQCAKVPEIANPSSWLIHPNDSMLPVHESYDLDGLEDYFYLNHTMFDNSPSNTSVFANKNMIRCCANGTSNNPQTAAIGYWSPVDPLQFPETETQWPLPFITKWIVGKPRTLRESGTKGRTEGAQILLFKDVPSLQAARCMPVIEVSDAKVVVDKATGVVYSYNITGSINDAGLAWSDVFVRHSLNNATQHYNASYNGPLNMTTSYGVLFMSSMFKAADINTASPLRIYWESLTDNAFVIRDQERGLNMDFMTYSMYSLANQDPEALLNYTTLVRHANRAFETFFQHFVHNGLSMTEGGLAYQKINDNSMDLVGPPVAADGSALPLREYAKLNTSRTVQATLSNRIQVLHMNSIATYLSTAILIWLIGTTAAVTCLQRKYTSSMIRDVQLIADVLVLIAGSDNLLQLIEERGVALKMDTEIKTMLGWFKDRDGTVRWGVEVVGGRDAVEWVDAPKTGWHVREKRSLLSGRKP